MASIIADFLLQPRGAPTKAAPPVCSQLAYSLIDGMAENNGLECTQMSQRSGQPVMFTLRSGPVDGADPWVLECEAGTPVVSILGVCKAAS